MAIKELFNDARPQVLFDPRASQRIDPRFKFTRNGPASYYDIDQLLIPNGAVSGQPRVGFNFDPETGEQGGLLLEKEGTNYTHYSRTLFSSRSSTRFGLINNPINHPITWANNAAIAPDGTMTAATIKRQANNYHNTFNVPVPYPFCFSIYMKHLAGPNRTLTIRRGGGGDFSATLNIDTKVMTGGGFYELPNGWFRIWLTANSGGRGFFILSSTAYSADDEIAVWGMQIETGTRPSSYIPTNGSSVTRPADLLSVEAPLPSTGSIYIDARSLTSDVDTTLLSAAPADPSTDKLALAIRQPASLYSSKALVYEVDGEFKPTLPFPVPTNARERNLITYGTNNYHYRTDSSRYTPSSSSSVPANMTRLGIGHDVTDPTKAFNGYINAVYLWPGEITPTVAEALVRGDVDPKDADAGVFTPVAGSLAFVFNTQGTATDGNTVVQLPLRGSTNNVLVDWGDNTSSSLIGSAASVTVNHTYPSAGIYPVQIEADDDGTNSGLAQLEFYNNSPLDLVRVLQWGGSTTFNPTTMYRAFRDCVQLDFATAARTNLPDTSTITNWQEAFYNCSSISGTFPTFDTTAATTFASTWYGCSSMAAFPFIESSSVTAFDNAWQSCSSLTSFPLIDTSSGANFSNTWRDCSSLTSFPLINTSSGANFSNTWRNCSSLTSFPLINTSSVANFSNAWRDCSSLTSFPLINTSSGTSFNAAWYNCPSLTSFPLIDTSSGTDFTNAWRACSSLTSFPLINTSSGTNFGEAWRDCSSLTSFPLIGTSAGTNFSRAWYNNDGLTAFPALSFDAATGLASDASTTYTGFREAWFGCGALADFPANRFDSTTCTRYLDAWTGCALTAQSIENILVSINTANTSNGNLGIGGGTNAAKSTWSTAANTAYDALIARGWTITYNA